MIRKSYKIALLVAVLLSMMFWLKRGYGFYQNLPIGVRSSGVESIVIKNIPYYLQGDDKWGKEKLGGRHDTIESSGCTVCCLSMAIATIGMNYNPKELNSVLALHEGFDSSGNIIWGRVPLTKEFVIALPKPSHDSIVGSLANGRPVLTKVRILEGFVHWVLIIGVDNGRYLIHDPLSNVVKIHYLDEITDQIDGIRVIQ